MVRAFHRDRGRRDDGDLRHRVRADSGGKPVGSRRDKLAAAAIGGTLGALVCAPANVIGRIGILLLGSHVLFPLGVALLVVGFTLEAGATGAVKAIKMSAKLAAGYASDRAAESPAAAGGA